MTPQEFVHKWKQAQLTERSASQQHFLDICAMIGHPTPADVDKTGESYTFEKGSDKTTGKKGFADVWKRGYFGWEYKGKHKDLDAAYQQLLTYRESLENPPLLVVSDMDRIVIHTNFTNTVKQIIELTYDDLLTTDGIDQLKAVFKEPKRFKSKRTTEGVTAEAAAQFAKLSEQLRSDGAEPHAAAHFLIRLLFCLFAEDVGLLPPQTLGKLIEATRRDPEQFAALMSELFGKMATGGYFGTEKIPFFNGSLFDDNSVLVLDRDSLDIVESVSRMDWGQIEPSIFGTLFERSLDPEKRSQLGAHYTSKEDILLIVEPVLMRPLRRRWEEVQEEAEAILEKREQAKSPAKKNNQQKKLRELLLKFADEIAEVTVLDPACGSGNFLYVALRQLLDLQKEVIQFTGNAGLPAFFPSVTPAQLHGIEINPYAHELASATIWIGYIQWLRENGFGFPPEPILQRLDTIENQDSILSLAGADTPLEPDWPEADVIIGNPPFLGDKRMRSELGDEYVDTLRRVYGDQVSGGADLVCYWFQKAQKMLASGDVNRVGLIATSGIRYGRNNEILIKISNAVGIFEAWSDRDWTLDGAAVRVSIICFGKIDDEELRIDGKPVSRINPDLTSSADTTKAVQLRENDGISFLGMMKSGPFDIDSRLASKMQAATGNPNGQSNRDVIKKRINGSDVVRRPSETYIIDFGVLPLEQAAQYSMPFEYVKETVKPIRDQAKRKSTRERWWRFGETRPALRMSLQSLSRCIVTPEVSKHRVFVWMTTDTIPDHKLHVIARDDDYFFGVLQSRPHEVWSLHVGNWRGVTPCYNSGSIIGTYAFPWPPGKEPKDDPLVETITEAARELVEKRDRWLNPEGATEAELKKRTLTNLYNERPTWLDLAHQKLDRAVFDAYGWPHDLSEDEILERLLALNLERAAAQEE